MDFESLNDKKGGAILEKDDFNAILRILLTLRRWRDESALIKKSEMPAESSANAVKACKTQEKATEKPVEKP